MKSNIRNLKVLTIRKDEFHASPFWSGTRRSSSFRAILVAACRAALYRRFEIGRRPNGSRSRIVGALEIVRPAGCKPAIQQIENLRYAAGKIEKSHARPRRWTALAFTAWGLLVSWQAGGAVGSWMALARTNDGAAGHMLLLSDATVMVQNG